MSTATISHNGRNHSSFRGEDQDEIEEVLSNATDFLAVESSAQEDECQLSENTTLAEAPPQLLVHAEETRAKDIDETTSNFAHSAAIELNTGIDHDDITVLCPEHLDTLDRFRRTLLSCRTDADKLQVCTEWRDKYLGENAALQYLVAEIETIMSEECKEYRSKKLKGWSKEVSTEIDAENWHRFIGIAREGDAIRKCLPPLRKVSAAWGRAKVQRYGWAYRGEKYCKTLGTAVSMVPDWSEAVHKLNQLMKRRTMMDGRRPFRVAVNPIDQVDLENLKRWPHKDPYIKSNDHEKVLLEYRELTDEDLPEDCGFDEYGLMVRKEFATTARARARARTVSSEDGQITSAYRACSMGSATLAAPSAGAFRSTCETENHEPVSTAQVEDTFPSPVDTTMIDGNPPASEGYAVWEAVDTPSSASANSDVEAVDHPSESITTADINATDHSIRPITPPASPRTPTMGQHTPAARDSTPTAEPVSPIDSDMLSPAISDIATPVSNIATGPSGEDLAKDGDIHSNESTSIANAMPTSNVRHTRQRTYTSTQSAPKPAYKGRSEARSRIKPRRLEVAYGSAGHSDGKTSGIRCQCSKELPKAFLKLIERDSDLISPDANLLVLRKLADYENLLCFQHLKRLAKWALAAIPHAERASPEADTPSRLHHFDRTPSRRRASSVPDITGDLPPAKKRRLDTLTMFTPIAEDTDIQDQRRPYIPQQNGRRGQSSHDSAGDAEFRLNMLHQLVERIELKSSKTNSWGELNDTAMLQLVSLATQPNLVGGDGEVDAYFLSDEEAATRMECTTQHLRVPIITCDQQQFRWTPGGGRPIEQFLRRIEGLDQVVSVQMPSLSIRRPSHSRTRLSVVKNKFLSDDCVSDRWNLLDLDCPLPGTLPNFLMGENCQLLSMVRNEALRGNSLDRVFASSKEWNQWKDVETWALLAQAGALTLRHQDSHGFGTWITVQEGHIGIGWMSRPTAQELSAWMADPVHYTGGKLRYVVLKPGQTIFIPSGVIHFVFRLVGEHSQTFAIGGHVLLWSSLDLWMEVILGQLRHPDVTNEEVKATIPNYVEIVRRLVSQRQKRGRVEDMGGKERVARFFALCEVCARLN